MKKILSLLMLSAFVLPSAFASESPEVACNAEADEVAFENQDERNNFIQDCIAQSSTENQAVVDPQIEIVSTDEK